VALPNINDDFFGAAPDMGAHENGRPLPHYGPREETQPTVPDPPSNLRADTY
jgi:hypothetical protein